MKIDVKEFLKPCGCGRKHEIVVDDIIIDSGAVKELPEILKRSAYADKKSLVMICDENTYEAAGRQVEELVPELKKIVLDPENLHANEHGVEAAKKGLDEIGDVDLMIAVGSGTIHDITRYHAYEMKIPFFSIPTAASVDGFVSTVAAMTWHGFKKSFTAVSPIVVIADTDIFKKAPLRLTASGVSDLLGKYTALADWKITHLLTGEYICDEICKMEYEALDRLRASLGGLTTGDKDAYENLMYGLLLSGLAMQMTGNSRPASGAEHHMSHLWEMEVINDYIDFYHGEKVGVGLVLASKIYHKAAERMLEGDFQVKDSMPVETDLIQENFNKPGMYEIIMEENTPNLLDEVDSAKLIEYKEEIASIIREIPTAEELIAMIDQVEGVKSLEDLGFDESYQAKTANLSPYVRARITFMRLLKFYDFYEEVISC
ncbi:MAG TPA: sn-glycerol-1-phosphate dehydrogenase [Candidatus Anaerostipes excrementavium]|uniref:Sn-glycerol-1-phosphate dehydrogenase n=1 Tax=Candidatus Anaerostipes excrementavium TaxID=2838463 RepID=A0A9D1WUI8_9FIRM|nr:sn-glycerol-1-phosphate dehydrogenase [uncultured Anaerostipes sp.]HIX67397.1 sn-glycerol-1-phosphate dehydrogenase [Candidatus Anaerostipes excrementavium]